MTRKRARTRNPPCWYSLWFQLSSTVRNFCRFKPHSLVFCYDLQAKDIKKPKLPPGCGTLTLFWNTGRFEHEQGKEAQEQALLLWIIRYTCGWIGFANKVKTRWMIIKVQIKTLGRQEVPIFSWKDIGRIRKSGNQTGTQGLKTYLMTGC